jgi:(p)ppGpp synthase/HD superfamily hydrolase
MPSGCQPFLTRRFDLALQFASGLHHSQCRKGTPIPYISHLMAVSALVLEAGGDEDLAIAALLHDAVEAKTKAAHQPQIPSAACLGIGLRMSLWSAPTPIMN